MKLFFFHFTSFWPGIFKIFWPAVNLDLLSKNKILNLLNSLFQPILEFVPTVEKMCFNVTNVDPSITTKKIRFCAMPVDFANMLNLNTL